MCLIWYSDTDVASGDTCVQFIALIWSVGFGSGISLEKHNVGDDQETLTTLHLPEWEHFDFCEIYFLVGWYLLLPNELQNGRWTWAPKGYWQIVVTTADGRQRILSHTKHISTTQPFFPVLPNPWMMKEVFLCAEKCDFGMVEEFIAEITCVWRKKEKVLCIHTFKHLKKSQLGHPVCRTQRTIFNGQSLWLWSSGTLVSRLSQFHYGFQRSCAHVVSIAPIYFAECRKNPLMWNMKQHKRATVSRHACWPELDKFLQRAAHYLHISWFSLLFHWPDLWLQCAALDLSNSFWFGSNPPLIGDVSVPAFVISYSRKAKRISCKSSVQ